MKNLFPKKYLSIALVGFLALAIFISSTGVTLAQTTGPTLQQAGLASTQTPSAYSCVAGGNLGTCLVYVATWFVATVIGIVISLGAILIKLGLAFNLNIYNSPFVQTGFGICLSIANLGFVLAMIIIAIATILHSETYGYKKALWRLVVMAILVNFGLVITAPVISFANSMTNYFVTSVNGTAGLGNFTSNMAKTFAPQSFDQPPAMNASSMCSAAATVATFPLNTLLPTNTINNFCNSVTGQQNPSPATSFSQALLSLVFQIIFSSLIAIAFFGLGALLLVRYIWLGVLLILLPFAWLAWIFPGTKSHFSKWWSDFIKWTFFAPAAMFFIYLAMLITAQTPANSGGSSYLATVGQAANTGSAAASGNIPEASIAQQIGQVVPIESAENDIIIIGLMIGGLLAASSLTGKAGSFVVEQAKGVTSAAQGYVGRKTKRVVGDRIRNAGRQYNPATRETTSILQRFGSRLQNVPGLRRTGAAIATVAAPATVKHDREKDIQEHIDSELKSLDNGGIISRATSRGAFVDPVKAAAIAQELARRNLTIDPAIVPLMDKFVNAAEQMGNLEKVLANRPDLMPQRPGETREQATARAITSAKGEIIQANSEIFNLANPGVAAGKLGPHVTPAVLQRAVLALSPAQLGALGSDTTSGSQDRQNNITDAVRSLAAGYRTMNATTHKYELDTTALTAAAAATANPALRNLEKIVKHMESSPNWGSVLN